MDLPRLTELTEKRRAIRHLLSATDPADALASYYALWHDPRRTQITLHYGERHHVDGFIVVSQTGANLFRPLVTLRAPDESAAGELLQAGLTRGRAYYVTMPLALAGAVRTFLDISQPGVNCIYTLNPAGWRPILNVLVQRTLSPDGAPRFEIRSQGDVMAMAGTNWRSPGFAEVFVYTHPRARGRGWGSSVVSACTVGLLEERLRPLYVVEETNDASIHTAAAVGYVDSGLREVAGEARLI